MKTKHAKKLLVLLISVMMIATLFIGMSIAASAEGTGTETSYTRPTAEEAKIFAANVNLGADISMKYLVEVGSEIIVENLKLRTEFLGVVNELSSTGTKEIEGVTYQVYVLEGINPQCMGDLIDAQLLYNGAALTCADSSMNDYSVKQNLVNIYGKADTTADVKQLIIDTLEYGAAAQVYRNYKTDALVTKDVSFISEGAPAVNASTSPYLYEGYTDTTYLQEVTVNFSNTNLIKIKYVNNGESVTKSSTAIAPYDFSTKYVFTVENGFTLEYSINDYCYEILYGEKTATYSDEMKALASALYNYGLSAHIVKGNHEGGDGTATCEHGKVCEICGEYYGELESHSFDSDHKCTVCGTACPHTTFTDGKCVDCGITGGYCGAATNEGGEQSVIWTYDEATKAFAVTGTGAMKDYDSYTDRPWSGTIGGTSTSLPATSVTISEGITRIGDHAFQNFVAIPAVTVPASVESLGYCAFTDCDSMQSITFAEGSRLTTLDNYVFQHCSKLQQITLPAGVTSIDSSIFSWCNALTDIFVEDGNTALKDIDGVLYTADGTTLLCYPAAKEGTEFTTPAGVTIIGEDAFEQNANLKTITLSEGVTTIRDEAFIFSEALETLNLPKSLTTMGYGMIANCQKLTSIALPETLTKIDEGAFSGSYLTEIHIPASVTSIGAYAFGESPNLTSVVIPQGVTTIGEYAFWWMDSLTTVTIPASVTSIGAKAFYYNDNLTTVNAPCNWDTANPLYTFESTVTVTVGDHIPNADGSTDNDDGTHSFTCVCGKTITEDHSLNYATDENSISVSCSANCGYTGSVTINATSKTYDGTTAVTVEKTGILANTDIPVSYTKDDEAFTGEPVNAGSYTASITLGGQTVSVEFTITKATPTYELPTGLTATYGDTLADVNGLPTGWAWKDAESTSVGNAGTRTFKALYNPDSNNYNTVEADVAIEVAKADIDFDTFTDPEFAEDLVYNGTAQALVTAPGSVEGGTLVYSLSPYDGYSETIPVATDADSYVVYYYIQGDENHNDYGMLGDQYDTVIIGARSGAEATITLEYTSVQFDGTAKTPGVTSVVVGGKTLNAETDYEISYENNTYVGTATVKITFKGNYTGTATATFEITQDPKTQEFDGIWIEIPTE